MKLLLPVDHVVADEARGQCSNSAGGRRPAIPADKMALDIGPKTIELFSDEIATARTIVWNGPMGVFEIPGFSKGTFKVAHAVADNAGAISIVGRRRLRRGREGRERGRQDHAHFHRRRSIAGISGRAEAAWSRGADGQEIIYRRSSVNWSGAPPKYCCTAREKMSSSAETCAKRVMDDLNFISSGDPKISSADRLFTSQNQPGTFL